MIPEFCKALKSSRFPDWGLHDMDIANRHGFSVHASLRNQCKVALFHTLPNLQLFCGLGPSESWPQEQLYHRFVDDMPNAIVGRCCLRQSRYRCREGHGQHLDIYPPSVN
jgi:hypothetical protein